MAENEVSVYEFVGGAETFRQLVDRFYAKVEADHALRSIFPDDLDSGKRYQQLFLMQYWGGPQLYDQERGHPRLRMRHAPFSITPGLRDRWVQYMLESIDEVGIAEPARALMRDYFERAGTMMINRYNPAE